MTPSLSARVSAIARAFVMGSFDVDSLVERGVAGTGESVRAIRAMASKVSAAYSAATRPRVRDIIALLRHDDDWLVQQLGTRPPARRRRAQSWLAATTVMVPVAAARDWRHPAIATTGELAEWLELSAGELAWFSNCAELGQQDLTAARHHYHYRLLAKVHGGLRLIEAPQQRLKAIQRRILTEILDHIPPYYAAAHGFVKGRSVRTFAAGHVAQSVVLRMDLAEFFPRISGARVNAVFRTLGYPESVAETLAGLCTNVTPVAVFAPARCPTMHASDLLHARATYARPHLPQGAPTSPALANMCAYRLDCRLTALADWAGAVYSRYADDLAFSGGADVARRIGRYAAEIGAIAQDEGWRVQHHKTRVMRRSAQQRLTGLVVNARVNVPRRDIDRIRAILTNCVRHGASTQNRERHTDFRAHLAGRIAWVRAVNPTQAVRLQATFDQIDWGR